jgi:hypothetical protein
VSFHFAHFRLEEGYNRIEVAAGSKLVGAIEDAFFNYAVVAVSHDGKKDEPNDWLDVYQTPVLKYCDGHAEELDQCLTIRDSYGIVYVVYTLKREHV